MMQIPFYIRALVLSTLVAVAACSNSTATAGGGADANSVAQDSDGTLLFEISDEIIEPADSGADLAAPVDVDAAGDATDAGPEVSIDAGCSEAGCACTENAGCNTGFCLEVDGSKQCAALCDGGCAKGFTCSQLSGSGGDVVNICTPTFPRLCEPCQADSDCNNVLGGADNRCVGYWDPAGSLLGHFCGAPCGDNSQCSTGFTCSDKTSVGGVKSKQCTRIDLVCSCDQRATKNGLTTACSNVNGAGSCNGTRSCSANGLSACDAPSAVSETCNLIDDDCDGQTDELSPGLCDDNSACTYDNCFSGQCQHPSKPGACDDGNACTSSDSCDNGVCKGEGVVCDDKNPCTVDSCDPILGCVAKAASGAACSDGNICTSGDACQDGACLPGAPTTCDDGNLCTTDSCDSKSGCVLNNNALQCSDGDACTLGDTCKGGLCVGNSKTPCSDGNPCTDDSCDANQGCLFSNNVAACSDNNACTLGDSCQGGSCQPGSAKACDDKNPCTNDSCDPKDGCQVQANSQPCSDANVCTEGDVCVGGTCQSGQAKNCDDGNPCTTDVCDSGKGCTMISNSENCTDNNVCSEGDQCQGGKCQAGKVKNCDDGNPCTDDACDPVSGCTHGNNAAPCNDKSVCTNGDNCSGSACVPGPSISCDDGNPCTDDSCDAIKGCQHINNTALCTDNNTCTTGDSCKEGVCTPSGASQCDDGNPCTTETCDVQKGCQSANNTAPCSDGSVCTIGDTCAVGSCAPGISVSCDDTNPCTNDSCDAAKGCQHAGNIAPCSDNNVCTAGDSCQGGSCASGQLLNCDDGNVCTDDSCDSIKGCQHSNNVASCTDGNVCSAGDQCVGGSCKAGAPLACSDGNPCTDDSCDAAKGCVFTNNTANCDDKNGCTGGDVCSGGQCQGSSGCDANAQCTPGAQSVSCVCKAGFAGNGFQCLDVNECNTGAFSCPTNTVCSNTVGSYTCVCAANYADCDGNKVNGCEVSLLSDVSNCNVCGNKCGAVTNGIAGCNAGKCGIGSCNAGFGDCNNAAADGCEINKNTDANNCNGCGAVCPAIAGGVAGCSAGKCGVGSCNSPFADCDSSAANGCEINTSNDINNCTGCGVVCSGTCANSVCTPSGQTLSNQIAYGAFYYATLDNVPASTPLGGWANNCQTTPIAMPLGWSVAPVDAGVIATIVAPNNFSTHCILFSDGTSYGVQNYSGGANCGCSANQCLQQSGNTYWTSSCNRRIMIRRPK